MMRKKIVSLCMALVLCLSLLPVTALADAPNGQVIYVGNENVTSGGYWTTDSAGNVTQYNEEGKPSNNYIHYNTATNTLTLHNATIKESVSTDTSTYVAGAAIGVHNQNGVAELTITLEGTNTIAEVGKGIYVLASSTGEATLTITSESDGSLDASASQTGIWVQSNSKNAALCVENAEVTASSGVAFKNGVLVQAEDGSDVSLTVNGGSLTASVNANIWFQFGSGTSGSGTPTVTVSNNAIVRANGGIANNSSNSIQYGTGNEENGGIVFDGKNGTVYGSATLQENLTIGEGESLTIPEGASLDTNGKTITVESGGKLEGEPTGSGTVKIAPTITTESLPGGTVGEPYTETILAATGDASITWSVSNGSLPAGLSLSENGKIIGTPTVDGTFNFTVKATNTGGSDSEQLSITINPAAAVPVESVSLDKTTLGLTKGETAQLNATVLPETATNRNVTWSTSDASIATVTDGVVTAVAPGTATITVTTVDQSKTATCTVTVTVPVTGVTLNKTRTSLYVGDTETLTATVAPDNATNQAVTWTSSNPSVATVKNGVVTAVAPGIAVITATTQDGNHTAACAVTVRPDVPPANPNYRITVEATQGGTVTADPTAAKAGTTVTLTPVPDRGYQVGTVAVTDRFGEAVAVTEQAGGTYTFTMPNGQVTVTVTFAETPLPFTDVTEGDWFYDAVRYAYETGLMDGVGDNLFAPNSETTRAQLVTILYRLAGQPAVSGDLIFTDVEAGTWYADAVAWAAENGIVNGTTDTTFAPGDDITREQLVTVLYRYAESKGYDVSVSADLSGYPDAGQVQDYAQPAMAWAVAEGIVEGVDGTLNPAGNATRAQIATILMRFCEGVAK